jgi:hypothetical protein
MRSIHFEVQGFSRTYWDLFIAAGFSVGVFYLFAAVLARQLGGLPAETLAVMRVTVWALALCFAAITVVSWSYLFILPIVFSIVITVCLTVAAWLSAGPPGAVGSGNVQACPVNRVRAQLSSSSGPIALDRRPSGKNSRQTPV